MVLREKFSIRDVGDAFFNMQGSNFVLVDSGDSSIRLLATKIQSVMENLKSYLDSNYPGWDH